MILLIWLLKQKYTISLSASASGLFALIPSGYRASSSTGLHARLLQHLIPAAGLRVSIADLCDVVLREDPFVEAEFLLLELRQQGASDVNGHDVQ